MLAQDRCDARGCGVQAYLRVALGDAGTLDFCHHHYALYEDTLLRQGAAIVADDRRMLSRSVLY
ncbi:MAG TPA: hypothetical protein VK204_07440 [Nocardioidaceae bacterium]|jgi:hypothetical protein|nr:hypothetical protein [Nocardioidaceae bacterium]